MAKTILVVDDMAIFREPIEAVLRAHGFSVEVASNGVEALAAMSRQRPDLVLLDLGMPVLDGLTALRRMREDPAFKQTTVIVLSAEADRAKVVEAVKLGIAGYILKAHFSLRAMLERVQAALTVTSENSAETTASAESEQGQTDERATAGVCAASRTAESAPLSGNAPPSTASGASAPCESGSQRSSPGGPAARTINPNASIDSLLPLMPRSAVLERVMSEGELTGFSPTVAQVLKLTANENCSMDQVAKAVAQDQAISLKILKLSNSSAYSHGDRVDTVHKAVLRIGMQCIRQAVLNIGVVERFGSLAFERHLSTPLFWEHSIACGLIAAQLARSLKHSEPDIAFTAGLLHDLGRVLFAERLGEHYVEVLDTAQTLQVPVEQVEARLLLMTHAEVMDRVLHAWRFPKQLVKPIVFHHVAPGDAKAVAGTQSADVLRLGLANRLAHALMLGCSGNDTIYPTEEHCRLLGVDGAAVRQIEEAARRSTDETKFALLTHSNSAAWPRRVDQCRETLSGPFRPLYLSASPELDAYRMFFNELAGPAQDEPPNLAIVHIASARERAPMTEMLAAAERSAGVGMLPVLLLSPGGRMKLGSNDDGRSVQTISTPTPASMLVQVVNQVIGRGALKRAA